MSTVFVLTAAVYSSLQTAIHVLPLGKIVLWMIDEGQPAVYAHLRYGGRNTKIMVLVDESIPAYILLR